MGGPAVADLGQAADEVAAFPAKAVKHIAKSLAKPVRRQIKQDLGGDSRMSGIGNSRLSVSQRAKGEVGSVKASPKKLRGPWSWMESGTKAHTTHGGTRRHPGTKGKRSWSKPIDKAVPVVEREVGQMWEATFR